MGSLAVSRFLYERRIANIKRKSSESLAKKWGESGLRSGVTKTPAGRPSRLRVNQRYLLAASSLACR
jgi:hypothetical protein